MLFCVTCLSFRSFFLVSRTSLACALLYLALLQDNSAAPTLENSFANLASTASMSALAHSPRGCEWSSFLSIVRCSVPPDSFPNGTGICEAVPSESSCNDDTPCAGADSVCQVRNFLQFFQRRFFLFLNFLFSLKQCTNANAGVCESDSCMEQYFEPLLNCALQNNCSFTDLQAVTIQGRSLFSLSDFLLLLVRSIVFIVTF